MSHTNVKRGNPSGYANLNQAWIKQPRYNLSTDETSQKENFGAFSISAAVRPSSCRSCNRGWDNPWYRGGQPDVYGVS